MPSKKPVPNDSPKKSAMDRVEEGQGVMYRLMSIVDSFRYMIDWIKGLFGR